MTRPTSYLIRMIVFCVIVYGGALHNDLAPPAERAAWSYAPELAAKSGGKLVAIDLFVPEMITDDASWKAFAWYPCSSAARTREKRRCIGRATRRSWCCFRRRRAVWPSWALKCCCIQRPSDQSHRIRVSIRVPTGSGPCRGMPPPT